MIAKSAVEKPKKFACLGTDGLYMTMTSLR